MNFIQNGISLREALSIARRLGLFVRPTTGTGEWLISSRDTSVRHDARRKDASRALVGLLRRAERSTHDRHAA
jgi:hypothetical protein